MEEAAVLNLLDSINSNDTVRQKFLEALNLPTSADADQDTDFGSQASGLTQVPQPEHPPTLSNLPADHMGIQLDANEHQLGNHSSLAANVHQLRG